MLQTKYLIVNADDFGQGTGINLSLMVRWPSAATARYARSHPNFSVGLHVDPGEWASVKVNGCPFMR